MNTGRHAGDANERRVAFAPATQPPPRSGTPPVRSFMARATGPSDTVALPFLFCVFFSFFFGRNCDDLMAHAPPGVPTDGKRCICLVCVVVPKLDALNIAHEMIAPARAPSSASATALVSFSGRLPGASLAWRRRNQSACLRCVPSAGASASARPHPARGHTPPVCSLTNTHVAASGAMLGTRGSYAGLSLVGQGQMTISRPSSIDQFGLRRRF